ncbi:hypothetical protein QBC37DRAFT_400574 [Rhypophila decipiens]|uniref:F-box domain-containing protein n=1 Tax=Rhypophila decipiens TaxID=261697 RepID=A0AAN7B7X5_9PEZI|nr:hypothetical protein QBC37DRAFT_400574 [Rhypophila decipiens]
MPPKAGEHDALPPTITDSMTGYVRAASLNNLAVELLFPIMKQVDDLHSLWALITASKRLYKVFENYSAREATEIVDSVMECGSTPGRMVHLMRGSVYIRFARAPLQRPSISTGAHTNRVKRMRPFAKFDAPVPKSGLLKLLHEAYHIHNLAHLCLERSLSKCRSMLGRLDSQVQPPIPAPIAAEMPSPVWYHQDFTWSQSTEEITMLAIWRLNYFYELKIEIEQGGWTNLSGNPDTYFHGLPLESHAGFDYLSTFFHSHVREQVLTVVHLLDELEVLHRPRPPTGLGQSGSASVRMWLDSLPYVVTETIENCYGYEWSRKHGPSRLPSTCKIMGTDNPSWGSRCAFSYQPPSIQRVREAEATFNLMRLELGQADASGSEVSRQRVGPDFRPPDSEYCNMRPVIPADPDETPAWTFVQNVVRPNLSSFGNIRLEKMPAYAFRDVGVYLFDPLLLTQLGLLPAGGLVQEHLSPDRRLIVNRVDKYAWLWMKLLDNWKLGEISMDEQAKFWEATQGHGPRHSLHLALHLARFEPARLRRAHEIQWEWKRGQERWRIDKKLFPYESWAHYDW